MVKVVTCFSHAYLHVLTPVFFSTLNLRTFWTHAIDCVRIEERHLSINLLIQVSKLWGNYTVIIVHFLLILNPRTFWTLSYQANLDISYDSFRAGTFIFLHVIQFQLWTFRTLTNIAIPWTWRTTRFVCGDVNQTGSVSAMINKLNLKSQEKYWKVAKALMMYRIVNHLVAIPTVVYIPTMSIRGNLYLVAYARTIMYQKSLYLTLSSYLK